MVTCVALQAKVTRGIIADERRSISSHPHPQHTRAERVKVLLCELSFECTGRRTRFSSRPPPSLSSPVYPILSIELGGPF